MGKEAEAFKAAVVGCRMGAAHADAIFALDGFELAALCDLNEETARVLAEKTGKPAVYTDYHRMLEEIRPEVVIVATPNKLHETMTLEAAASGAKGIYCEKPMAVSLGEAQRMVDACRKSGAALAIGHQRRMMPVFKTMRRLIREGVIGDVYLMRGVCPGDFLSDGTHTVDTLLWLNGDGNDAEWILGQVHREKPMEKKEDNRSNRTGWRFGHPVETGAMAVVNFKNGVRAEIFTGDMRYPGWNLPHPGWAYQDIEVFGAGGRLWRGGDAADPQLRIWDEKAGGWREVELDPNPEPDIFKYVFKEFASFIRGCGDFPLCADKAIRGMEIVMAVYESARLHEKIWLPLKQERFPLEMMVERY
ncbi:MAG: Gfo/Idh/MocA family protein [Bacillota bacterium]